MLNTDIDSRFWSKIDKGDGTGCWLWTAAKRSSGYGQFWLDGHQQSAHRASWQLHHGPIPEGMFVCHHCDVRPCVNPSHLFLGTLADNHADMCAKGRQARGEKHGWYRHPERRPCGDRNGMRLHPERAARGERNGSRTHPERVRRGEQCHFAKLDDDKVRAIRVLYADGYTRADLARHFARGWSTISDIVHGRKWKHVTQTWSAAPNSNQPTTTGGNYR